QRPVERLLFIPNGVLHLLFAFPNLRKHIAHRLGQHVHQLVEKRLVKAQGTAVANGATQDPAQDVTTTFVRGLDAVGDGEAQRADVIGNNAESNVEGDLLSRSAAIGSRQRAA